MSIYDAAMKYRDEHVPLIIFAGKGIRFRFVAGLGRQRNYFAGRSRGDGGKLRAHSSQQSGGHGRIAVGIPARENLASLGLTGLEIFEIEGLAGNFEPRKKMKVRARRGNNEEISFNAMARIDTPFEVAYYQHGGILQYVLRRMS